MIRLCAWCGAVAPPLFLLAILSFAAMRSDYDHAHKAVSELGVYGAPNMFAWNLIGFIAVGSLIAALSWGLFKHMRSWLCLLLVGISGLGFAGAGIFPADLADLKSTSSQAHIICSFVSFFAFVIGAFSVAWVYARDGWPRVAAFSVMLGILAFATMPLRATSMPPGIAQRISFAIYLFWIEMLSVNLLIRTWPRRVVDDQV